MRGQVIVGLGVDIAEIDRIEATIARHGAPFLERIYHASRSRLLRAAQEQIRALRGAIRGEGSDDEGARDGLAPRSALARY